MLVDANGRRPMSPRHELELNQFEQEFANWLSHTITTALKRAAHGQGSLDYPALKEKLDQLYFLGRHHEAGG
jgi:hypothetical protein